MPDWTPDQFEQWASGIPAAVDLELRRAVNDSADLVQAVAVAFSSGPLTPQDLAALDHPYARRHGTPRQDPGLINVLSGAFRAAWEHTGAQQLGDGWEATVHNTDPKAPLLKSGTRFMFARPVDEKTALAAEPAVLARIAQAITEGIEP